MGKLGDYKPTQDDMATIRTLQDDPALGAAYLVDELRGFVGLEEAISRAAEQRGVTVEVCRGAYEILQGYYENEGRKRREEEGGR